MLFVISNGSNPVTPVRRLQGYDRNNRLQPPRKRATRPPNLSLGAFGLSRFTGVSVVLKGLPAALPAIVEASRKL